MADCTSFQIADKFQLKKHTIDSVDGQLNHKYKVGPLRFTNDTHPRVELNQIAVLKFRTLDPKIKQCW